MTLPAHEDMVASILATYDSATRGQRIMGRGWYPAAGRMVRAIAAATRTPESRVAYALAALSPRNPWRWNVADAYAFAAAAAMDGDMPSATTFMANRRRAWAALQGAGDPWTSAAPKVRSFVAAVLGDLDRVVVDVWAMRVVSDGRLSAVTKAQYKYVEAAYREAAVRRAETPADMQAITWIVAQADGRGSARRGRNDETFKRGTATLVRALFKEGKRA